MPWSRPTPYTVCGRRPTLGTPRSAWYSLAVASFTLLYLFAFAGHGDTVWGFGSCIALLVVGAVAYLRSRTYYLRVGFDYAPKWHLAALVVAGAAAIFWLLFVFLAVLAYFGFPVAPVD